VRFYKSLEQAFVLKSSHIESLWSYLHDVTDGVTSAETECADDAEREFDQSTLLTDYENPPKKKITGLTLQSSSRDVSISVRFRTRTHFPVGVSVEAPDESAERIYQQLRDKIRGTRPWYGVLAEQTFASFLVLLALGYLVFRYYLETEEYGELRALLSGLGAALVVNELRKWAFPSGYFALGQGEQRHRVFEILRWTALSLVGTGLVGVLVTLLI